MGSNANDDTTDRDFDGNGFLNCNFIAMDSGATFFRFTRQESDNVLINCIVADFDVYDAGPEEPEVNGDYIHVLGFSALTCLFHDNLSFDTDLTSGNDTTGDPDFTNDEGLDEWNIGSDSDCDDAGTNVSTYGTADYDGDARESTYDIGAQEYIP
jgi:hypothetical protein